MYKSKLQELCQQKSWLLPEYSTGREGLDHNPRFTATVTVNGVAFRASDLSRNAKEAQNKAAQLALDHLSPDSARNPNLNPLTASPPASIPNGSITDLVIRPPIGGTSQPTMIETIPTPLVNESPSAVKDDKKVIDVQHLYKNQLQSYAQKKNLNLPEYSSEREGPLHGSRFKSKVTIDGKTYESPHFFPTIKEAEHAAAKVAWESFSINEVQEDDCGLYKNLLQELAQKEGFHIPKYSTTSSGPPHMPTFVSTVEIGGQSFEGPAAKSKKQAEMIAAKIAYASLQQLKELVKSGRGSLNPAILPSGCQIKEALEASSSILQSVITGDLQQSFQPKAKLTICELEDKEYTAVYEKKSSSKVTAVSSQGSSHHSPPFSEADLNAKRHRCLPSSDIGYANLRDPFPSTLSSPEDGSCSPSQHSECSNNSSMDSKNEPPIGASTANCANIVVYPRVPNMVFPHNAVVLPFSDDKWVALKMNSRQY